MTVPLSFTVIAVTFRGGPTYPFGWVRHASSARRLPHGAEVPLNTVVYQFNEPAFPAKEGKTPRLIPTMPLEEALTRPHDLPSTVLCPLSWPGLEGFRPSKVWLANPAAEFTPLGIVLLDFDRLGHRPWPSVEDAAVAVDALTDLVRSALGGFPFVYASPAGARVLALPPSPVPLRQAESYLLTVRAHLAGRLSPSVGLKASADALTWTTGQRPPWLPKRPAPWGLGRPPMTNLLDARPMTWAPPADSLQDELTRLGAYSAAPRPLPQQRQPSPDDLANLRRELHLMCSTVYRATARHPTLYACARRFGGYLANFTDPDGLLYDQAAAQLAKAAPDSNDALRTARDGLADGLLAPQTPTWGLWTAPDAQTEEPVG